MSLQGTQPWRAGITSESDFNHDCVVSLPAVSLLEPGCCAAGQIEGAERPKVPVTIGQLLRQPIVTVLLVAGMLAAGSLTFLDPTLGPFLERVWGWDVATIGLGFGTTAVLYAIITPFAGCHP